MLSDIAVEVWLPVLGYEGIYEASNLGRIRRLGGASLAANYGTGYAYVTLCSSAGKKTVRLHRVVLEAFCGPAPFEGAHACHNSGDRLDNRLANLRWASPTENQRDVDRHGTRCFGARVHGAKLNDDQVREIKRRAALGEGNPTIAADFGVSISTVHLIRHNATWKHIPCPSTTISAPTPSGNYAAAFWTWLNYHWRKFRPVKSSPC